MMIYLKYVGGNIHHYIIVEKTIAIGVINKSTN